MSTMKKIGSLLLAFSLVVTPAMINADNMDKDLINEDVDLIDEAKLEEYISYEGHIVDVNEQDGNISIWVQDEADKENSQDGTIFHIEEDYIKEDMEVSVFYKANTPMTMSMPPQATPNIIVIREKEKLNFIKVAKFNDKLVSMDNGLKINIEENTAMVDLDGKNLAEEDLKGETLLVFYGSSTKSLPPQTNPYKVIVLDELDLDLDEEEDTDHEITVFDKILIDRLVYREDARTIELNLENNMYKDKDDVLMIPLREVGEALGYEVRWNAEKRSTELMKDAQWTEVVIGEGTVGEDNYNFAKMIVKLGTPPVLKNSTTYVPANFVEEILEMKLNLKDGTILITE
jgi:copper amine oxidase-like protein